MNELAELYEYNDEPQVTDKSVLTQIHAYKLTDKVSNFAEPSMFPFDILGLIHGSEKVLLLLFGCFWCDSKDENAFCYYYF